jgi:hypothetical protein
MPPCSAPTVSVGPAGHPTGLPLLGLSKDRPSVVLATPESTPGRILADSTFGKSLPRLLHVPPSWFLTTSTGSSSDAGRVSCNTLPTLGFIPFAGRLPRRVASPRPLCPSPGCCPALRSLPSVRSCCPRRHRLPARTQESDALDDRGETSPPCCHAVHRLPCPLTLSLPPLDPPPRLPARSCPGRVGRASRPSSTNGSVARTTVACRLRPVLPWACPDAPPLLHRERHRRRRAPGERQRPLPDPMTALPRPRDGPRKQLSVRTSRQACTG